MGRSRPKKKAATTPPASVRVFSSTPTSSDKGTVDTTRKVASGTQTLETIVEEPVIEENLASKGKKEEETPKLWVDIIQGNRLPSNGTELSYTAPVVVDGEMEIQIEEQDVASEKEFWRNALIMYAIGNDLSMNAVKKFMATTWNFVSLPEIYYNEEGYFLIRFKTRIDRDAVLMRGPYTIFKKPILLHEWSPKFTLQDDVLRVLPIWVIFQQLPLYFWGPQSIGKIASAIGKPIMTDECTAKKLRVSYARVLIEVDVTQELKHQILIRGPQGEKMIQQVDYEWTPPFCKSCNKVGHMCKAKEEIPRKAKETKKIWEQKKEVNVM
ncbi:uncharacterized protein LOC131635682 [Vicia villosa]|uniref:uncharacterized protein LOC131635682 n=1 Tax=Vicia villosa TaxID=3911 RepID=UPI00273C8AF1|nr:uncharacterized protein LOC131635682 [Vicia villosa]